MEIKNLTYDEELNVKRVKKKIKALKDEAVEYESLLEEYANKKAMETKFRTVKTKYGTIREIVNPIYIDIEHKRITNDWC